VTTVKAIIDKCTMQSVHEVRHITDEYGEFVVFNTGMEELTKVFVDLLGAPQKPAGVKPSDDDLTLTEGYGGIRINQTLFKRVFEDFILVAMYWPWEDGVRTTVKMAHLRK